MWPDVPAPTVLVHGADSPVVTAAGAAGANPKADLVEVPGVGHMVFWDDPAADRPARLALIRWGMPRPGGHRRGGGDAAVDGHHMGPVWTSVARPPHRAVTDRCPASRR